MRIAIVGSGGLGGYYGGLLALAGHEVTFLARGAHLEALQAKGLQVKSVHGDFHVAAVRATSDPAEAGPADLVLVCVKTPALDAAAKAARVAVAPDGVVVGLQNGIDAAERIGAEVGMDRVIGAVTWIASLSKAFDGSFVSVMVSPMAIAPGFVVNVTFSFIGDLMLNRHDPFVFPLSQHRIGLLECRHAKVAVGHSARVRFRLCS